MRRKQGESDLLGKALEAWRGGSAGDERLGDEARAAVLQAAMDPQPAGRPTLAPLFLPLRWLAVAGVLPLLVAVVFLAVDRPVPTAEATVKVARQNGHLVFTIANGSGEHTVYTSNSPDSFDESSGVRVTDGVFVDRVDRGGDLVFYRID